MNTPANTSSASAHTPRGRHRHAAGQPDVVAASASPDLSAGAVQRRSRRQNTALLTVASAAALWLGMSAPGVSPVAPPTAASTVAAVTTTNPVTTNPVTTDPGNATEGGLVGGGQSLPDPAGPFGGGGDAGRDAGGDGGGHR